MDDPVLLDEPPWLGQLLADRLASLSPLERLFPASAGEVVALLRSAATRLGVETLCIHKLRHGGASEDLLGRTRDSATVKVRGRWKTETSLRRYAKPAQIQRLLNHLDPRRRAYAEQSWER